MDAIVTGRRRLQFLEEGKLGRIAAADIFRIEGPAHQQRAVVAEQPDAAARAYGESAIESLKEAEVDRGRRNAGEAAVGIIDAPRQQHRPTAAGSRHQRGIDAELPVWMGLVELKIVAVAVVVVPRRADRGEFPPAVFVQHDYFAQLRQFLRISGEQMIKLPGLRIIALPDAIDDIRQDNRRAFDGAGGVLRQRVGQVFDIDGAAREHVLPFLPFFPGDYAP